MLRRIWLITPVVLALALVALPAAASATPLAGTVTKCQSASVCAFTFNTTKGTGWANATSTGLSFRLPGEAKTSTNLSYSTYIARLTGTYTYWTVGNFYGTDVNTGYVVHGTTNTNFTITCHGHSGRGGGCTYTYTTDNGTILFFFTKAELTRSAISCSPSSLQTAGKTTCTATVTNLWNASKVPTGTVHFSNAGYGTFSNKGACTLNSTGSCKVTWQAADETLGTVTLDLNFGGSASFWKSSWSTTVYIASSGN